ncbi:MAG: type II secretion system F family protein [Actinobacteria bacterium]|nr:type II secretion system F family protein [Actinomycetota bacterium]
MLDLPLPVYGYVGAVVLSVPVLWWSVASADPPGHLVRTNLIRGRARPSDVREVELTRSARERLLEPILGLCSRTARRLVPSTMVTSLENRIARAGMTGRWPVERALAMKLIIGLSGFGVGLLAIASNPSPRSVLLTVALAGAGSSAPEILLAQRARARQAVVLRKLPDTLDEITISVEAGLGFEAAMAEAGRSGSGPLAEELIRTLQDIQLGVPRSAALSNLVNRTDVPDLRHFVIAVRQAEQYGVPIAQVLRVQSKEMRERRRQRAEERAMKMPVKILIPTVFFILPALFIVILGPAVLRLADSLGR